MFSRCLEGATEDVQILHFPTALIGASMSHKNKYSKQVNRYKFTRPTETNMCSDAALQVQLKVLKSYASYVGWSACLAILVLFGLYQLSNVCANFWLADWTQDPTLTADNSSTSAVIARNHYFLTYYGLLGVGQGRNYHVFM